MPRPPLWYLQRIELFADIGDEELAELLEGIVHNQYACKHILYTPNDKLEDTFILKEGEVTLYQSVNGKKMIIDILKPGAIFGNIVYPNEEGHGHYAEVTQDAFVCTLPRDFFLRLAKKRPDIALNALKILSDRIAQYQSQLRLLSMLSARQRILTTIDLVSKKEDKSILPAILRRPTKLTHEKLANMTGLTRETVTKQLQELEKDKCITVEKKHIRITAKGQQELENS